MGRYDSKVSVEDVFDLQDQITECVVGAIEPSLLEAEAERLRPRPTDSLIGI